MASRRPPGSEALTQLGPSQGDEIEGRWRLERRLGRGGMGEVWQAADSLLDDRKVALKLLPSMLAGSKRAQKALRREAARALDLNHPSVARVHHFGVDGDRPFVVMELIDGPTLTHVLDEEECLEPARVVEILRPLAEGLAHAHARGLVHRDVKPANVLLRRPDLEPVLIDFGIAAEARDQTTRAGVTAIGSTEGTLSCMSPEQLRGRNPTPSMDVYSLAAMAYEMLCGQPPFFRGDAGTVRLQILYDAPPDIEGVPEGIWRALLSGLAKDPAARPEGPVALVDALQAGLEGAATRPATTPASALSGSSTPEDVGDDGGGDAVLVITDAPEDPGSEGAEPTEPPEVECGETADPDGAALGSGHDAATSEARAAADPGAPAPPRPASAGFHPGGFLLGLLVGVPGVGAASVLAAVGAAMTTQFLLPPLSTRLEGAMAALGYLAANVALATTVRRAVRRAGRKWAAEAASLLAIRRGLAAAVVLVVVVPYSILSPPYASDAVLLTGLSLLSIVTGSSAAFRALDGPPGSATRQPGWSRAWGVGVSASWQLAVATAWVLGISSAGVEAGPVTVVIGVLLAGLLGPVAACRTLRASSLRPERLDLALGARAGLVAPVGLFAWWVVRVLEGDSGSLLGLALSGVALSWWQPGMLREGLTGFSAPSAADPEGAGAEEGAGAREVEAEGVARCADEDDEGDAPWVWSAWWLGLVAGLVGYPALLSLTWFVLMPWLPEGAPGWMGPATMIVPSFLALWSVYSTSLVAGWLANLVGRTWDRLTPGASYSLGRAMCLVPAAAALAATLFPAVMTMASGRVVSGQGALAGFLISGLSISAWLGATFCWVFAALSGRSISASTAFFHALGLSYLLEAHAAGWWLGMAQSAVPESAAARLLTWPVACSLGLGLAHLVVGRGPQGQPGATRWGLRLGLGLVALHVFAAADAELASERTMRLGEFWAAALGLPLAVWIQSRILGPAPSASPPSAARPGGAVQS